MQTYENTIENANRIIHEQAESFRKLVTSGYAKRVAYGDFFQPFSITENGRLTAGKRHWMGRVLVVSHGTDREGNYGILDFVANPTAARGRFGFSLTSEIERREVILILGNDGQQREVSFDEALEIARGLK